MAGTCSAVGYGNYGACYKKNGGCGAADKRRRASKNRREQVINNAQRIYGACQKSVQPRHAAGHFSFFAAVLLPGCLQRALGAYGD